MEFRKKSNVKMVIAYDGTGYLGWQKTKMGATIEGCLEEVLEQILQEQVTLQAASRTDAGVHADNQVVNFIIHKPVNLEKLHHSLNRLLPTDIRIIRIKQVADTFHPTLNAKSKEYHYFICNDTVQLPQHRLYSWHYPYPLNLQMMRKAAGILMGTHDFSAFCNFKKNSSYEHYVRTVTSIEIYEQQCKRLKFKIEGENFLYKMVRNIVGTLVYVGVGKISIEQVLEILNNRDRTLAGITAPAHGLFLHKVKYAE